MMGTETNEDAGTDLRSFTARDATLLYFRCIYTFAIFTLFQRSLSILWPLEFLLSETAAICGRGRPLPSISPKGRMGYNGWQPCWNRFGLARYCLLDPHNVESCIVLISQHHHSSWLSTALYSLASKNRPQQVLTRLLPPRTL